MKKILRTKLQYNCDKREDFDYVEREYKISYNRSYDMYVSASTKEDCERVMKSFEVAISDADIQSSFESNLEPQFDEKKKLWIGVVEVYVGNNYVAEEKEAIKEAYNEWKEQLKKAPTPTQEIVEEKTSQNLIETVVNLSSGTIATISKDANILEKDSEVTYEDIDRVVNDWISFIEANGSTHEKWQDSWREYASSKKQIKEEINMKKIGGAIYIHRSNVDSLDQQQLELVWERLEQLAKTDYPCNSYEVIKIKGDTVSFIECEGWDELREPIVGNAYNVKSDGSVKLTKKREKNPQIYHHKWMFVSNDYDGFDVEKEKAWSKRWQSVVPKGLSASLGSIDNWKKFLRDYGLEN